MSKTWKARERSVARFFGAVGRTPPLSGGNGGITRSDTLHEVLFVEHKHSVRHAIINLWDKIRPLARKESKSTGSHALCQRPAWILGALLLLGPGGRC